MVFIAIAAFVIIGFMRDGNKIFSTIAMLLGGFLFFMLVKQEINEDEQNNGMYSVRYEVDCTHCDVSYTNSSGGTDKESEVKGTWSQTVEIRGDEFVYLSASNEPDSYSAGVRIYVNDKFVDGERSSGQYSSASVSCQPKDIYKNSY